MTKMKLLGGVLLVLAVLFAQVGSAAAAPQIQGTTITGIETETDENGVTTVLVTFDDTQTVRISLKDATDLGLIDPTTQEPVLLEDVPAGTTISPGQVLEEIPVEEPVDEDVHPISDLLAGFFFPEDESMPGVIDGLHTGDNDAEHVFGFGVIAQALWMSRDSDGVADADLAQDILLAKQTKNFEQFFKDHPDYLSDDSTAPSNWGQFKKAVKAQKENQDKHNLGTIVSEQADDEDALTEQENGKSNKKNKAEGKGKEDKGKENKGNKKK
ncbi:MAG: hypothetical protein EHM33_10255 [Chloroflexi bacterium]|nr:MAG: hypothetical protein EHM33_10255 [Chloroflexota bacterium]